LFAPLSPAASAAAFCMLSADTVLLLDFQDVAADTATPDSAAPRHLLMRHSARFFAARFYPPPPAFRSRRWLSLPDFSRAMPSAAPYLPAAAASAAYCRRHLLS